MSINWGAKIAILYIGFVVLIVSLVIGTMNKKTDLVSDDYYQQETVYQQRLNATRAADALVDPIKIKADKDVVDLIFPKAFEGQVIDGTIHFYAPSNSGADYTFKLQKSPPSFRILRNQLKAVPYEVQVSWSAGGKDYYQAIPLKLK